MLKGADKFSKKYQNVPDFFFVTNEKQKVQNVFVSHQVFLFYVLLNPFYELKIIKGLYLDNPMEDETKQYFFNKGYCEGFFTGFIVCAIAISVVIQINK